NWLRQDGHQYPEYRTIRPGFDQVLAEFREFLIEERPRHLQAGHWQFRPNQWEVIYVNHFPKGTVWNTLAESVGLFRVGPLLQEAPGGTSLENFNGEWHYEIPPKRGRLHVRLQHGYLKSEVFILSLTARGPISDATGEALDLHQGLNLGHETVV